ncbi:hypothetical protein niasHT_003722 [Heterodera trifolii]|uniref:Integrase catalytic domain-containing protein n=1 Tax=Heterodera trifolii TaxID=157864 RepID=A0ABD2LT12_9BILA
MASKFILVPDEIYHGLTNNDSENINLGFAQRTLERTKRRRENVTAKNVHYNQELARYLHLRDEQQNRPTKVEITKGLKALIKRGDESDEEQVFDLGADGAQPPASQSRRRHRRPRHYNDDEEMPLIPLSPPPQAENRGQKRKANEFYSSWEEGAKRQLRHEDEPVPSSTKIVNRQRRRKLPPVSWRREEQQIPADIQQEEPFQPAPQPSIPIHPQLNRKRKAQHALNDVRESKKSLIGLEELRPPSLQQEASLRFKQKRTNKSRVTLPQHSNSLAVAKLRNPPRDLLAEAASAPLPDDDADDFELLQSPGIAAQLQPLPPGPPLPSKAKKRKRNKVDEDIERKSIRIDSRKRDLLAEAASAPLPDDFELSQQPGTSAQVEPLPPGPPLPSRTKKRKTNKAEEEHTERKRSRIGSRKRLSSPSVTKNLPKRQKDSGSDALSEEQRRQFAEDQHLFTIPNSQLTNEQKRRRLQFVFNRNPTKYGVHGDTILNSAGNPITDSSVAQALDYIIERREGRIPQFRQPPGTKFILDRINRDLILRTWTAPPRNEAGESQGARRIDASVSNEGSQAEVDGPANNRNGNPNQKPASQATKMEKTIENVLERLYNDPKSPAAFAGVDRLWLEAKKELGNKIRKNDVKHYLEGHRTYTLMRPRRINFPRARTTAAGFMTDCQVDLADFQALSRHNSGNRYLMVVIDVLSKRIFVTPLRTKKSEDMVEGFKRVFSTMPMKPHRIFSDKGTEFRNHQLKKLFDEEEVEKYESTHSEKKAALAERAIRQIKNRVYRYFAQTKTLKWVDVIDQIVDGINKSPSRVHGMRPIDVNFKNSQQIWEKMFGEDQHRALFGKHRKRARFVPGQTVRMSIAKAQFEKGYIPNYGDEILEIDAVKRHMKPMRYKIRDAKGEKFKGFFYPEELTPVRRDAETTYRIERVFRKRKMPDGTMEVLVKFVGVRLPKPIYFNGSWVCGLHSISYAYSWPSTIGTLDDQWINIHFTDGLDNEKLRVVRVPVPKASNTTIDHLREFITATLKNHAESLESLIKDGSHVPIRRKRGVIEPTSPPSALIAPKSPPNVTKKVIVPTSPPRVGQNPQEKVEDISDSLTNVTKPPEKQPKIQKQPEVVKPKSEEIKQTQNISHQNVTKPKNFVPPPPVSTPTTKKQEELKSIIGPTPSVSKPPPPLPVSNPDDQNKNESNQSVPQNITKKKEELKTSSDPTHSFSTSPAPLRVSNQTTISQAQQITPAQKSETKTPSSISEVKRKEIGPPPKQRNEKSIIEPVSPPPRPQPAAPTHSNVSEKKATTPPRVIATEIIGPPPKQRNEKSVNTKQGQAQLVTEITPENTKKTTTITTTTTTTITEPPKNTIGDLVGRIEEPAEKNNAEKLLSVLFGNEEWKKVNLRILRQIIEGVELQYHPNFERFKAVFTHPRIEFISFSPQLGYVLGFENSQHVRNNEIAKYGSDLRGGFASFAVYAKGLTENMIVGNSLSSLLRVVSVSGAVPGAYTEKIYDSPLYARVLPKEVSEIEIELRTMTDGRLVPFSYGTVLVVLIFKKVINF